MAHIIKAYDLGNITLAPKSTEEEILQNVAMIVSTPQFSVPLDRGFGLPQRFVDKPIQTAQAILVSEVLDAVEKYERRVEVLSVSFEQGEQPGSLIPILEVNIIDE